MPTQSKPTKRKQAHAEMLKAALARPGIREAVEVYCTWLKKDQGLNPYRSATQNPVRVTTTNSSRIS